ncbi:MAG: hypothetical protein JOY90_28785 [Bradyrhizobium sp.]|nr:hypothetical protein [Bradyrhizobium sp.]
MITDLRFKMARRHSWLRAAYLHDGIVKQVLNDPAVASNSNITIRAGTRARELESPDAKIGANFFLDVIPDTLVSRQAHLGRSGIDHQDQLITYPPKTEASLRNIFEEEGSPSAADGE